MKVFHDPRQRLHNPQFRLSDGQIVLNPDRPERVDALLDAVVAVGLPMTAPMDAGLAPLAAVHSPRYLTYLSTIFARRKLEVPHIAEVVPTRFCRDDAEIYSDVPEAQIGFHNTDTSCPISETTWSAVYWSAQCAVAAADSILAGDTRSYALCRPSGHHAYREMSGGFCFVNNTAVAAQRLVLAGRRPAILDIDVHHGNGTQSIFYDRADVLTLSIHVDPTSFYPFYCGSVLETGVGAGRGYNRNFALPAGTCDDKYLSTLSAALEQIQTFAADTIVLALGLDTHVNDPFRGMSLTTDAYGEIAARLTETDCAILVVQEGGYMQPSLGTNLHEFLGGLI